MESKQDNELIIFSPSEGFWSDDDGWGFCPSEASICDDLELGDQPTFISTTDATVVKRIDCEHLDEEGALSTLFSSFSQFSNETIAILFTQLTGSQWTALGGNLWQVDEGVARYDEQHLEEILIEQSEFSMETILSLLNAHASGTFYDDNHGGIYRHDPSQ